MAAASSSDALDLEAFYKMANYPLVKSSSGLDEETRVDIVDICSTAVEKHADALDKCSQAIKDSLDARVGGTWHAVAGPYFSYSCTNQNELFVFVGGKVGVLVWKV